MGDNSTEAPPPMADSSSPSLLWVPYLSLTLVLLLIMFASFVNYHMKNRDKYENEKIRKAAGTLQKQVQKYRVTLNLQGERYETQDFEEHQQRRSLKRSCDSNSTAMTSLDSIKSLSYYGAAAGDEPFANDFACYQNAAFVKSEPSLAGTNHPDMLSVKDEGVVADTARRFQNGGWNVASGSSSVPHHLAHSIAQDGRRYMLPPLATPKPCPSTSQQTEGIDGKQVETPSHILSVTPANLPMTSYDAALTSTSRGPRMWSKGKLIPLDDMVGSNVMGHK